MLEGNLVYSLSFLMKMLMAVPLILSNSGVSKNSPAADEGFRVNI